MAFVGCMLLESASICWAGYICLHSDIPKSYH
jgi:hypothetical protein